ncbi:fatty acid desaturase [Paragemmobacter ruber]|uniref:Fatty acid desaturase n=1 Tax=Paragemmobacter ruber TaxID=1985673 RepID=A0ABW9YA48_9RHOB|nr:fatty acid desaturase [Rhodobacter ruber]NBE08662.1 fatty acid desaturase [Rhodobacter ruber]
MDHKTWLAALPAEAKAQLSARSDAAGLRHLALHLGAILALGGIIAAGVLGWWLLLPVQGVLIVFLFTLEHEATHQTPFARIWLNEAAGHLCGFLLVLPFLWFRYFHLAHHRWTNIEGRDPELDGAKPETRAAWLWHVSGLPYWMSQARLVIGLALGRVRAPYLPEGALPRITREARVLLAGYALVLLSFFWTTLLLWIWVIPALLGQPFLRLYLLAEHGDCPRVADMFLNTRTTFTNRIVRFVAWNMPYHVEHHVAPTVPFHHLPALHALMRDRLAVTAEGYRAFTRDYLARRR